MKERALFEELVQGLDAWDERTTGKRTLPAYRPANKPLTLKAGELTAIRESLKIPAALFADYLRIDEPTYQRWEAGTTQPNPQAVLLIRMVQRDPNILAALVTL
ncbi:transcriptional regulator (plasmid) [Nissabacter sp. SGAir0207]|nr:transcriptional regulator [Nissabacter sp. SGAir0207]